MTDENSIEQNGKKNVWNMGFLNKKIDFLKASKISLALFLFVLPWQTVYIFREVFWESTKWQYGTLNFYFFEVVLWFFIFFGFSYFWKNKIKNFKNLKTRELSSGIIFTKTYKFWLRLQEKSWSILWYKQKFFFSSRSKFKSFTNESISENNSLKQKIIPVFFTSLIFLFLIISSFFVGDPALAFQKLRQIIQVLLFLFLIISLPIKFNFIVKWFFIGSILPTVLGVWQFIAQNSFSSTLLGISEHLPWVGGSSVISNPTIGYWLRAYGSFAHPNIFGGYLFFVLVSLFIYFYNSKKYSSLLIFIIFLLPTTGLFLTFSRSAWIVFLLVFIITFFISFLKKKDAFVRALFYLSFFIISLVFIFFPLVQTRISGNSITEIKSVQDRMLGYSEAKDLFIENLFFGVGGGNYTLALKEKNPNLKPWKYQPVHNIFMLFLVEYGLIGFTILFGGLYVLVKEIKIKKCLNLTTILSLCLFIILGIFDHYLYSFSVGLLLPSLYFAVIYKYFLDKKHKV
ncbi:MAG: O-antigen ligase family protein [Candidatus Magasanikbacteria bacterium]|nr:O-antigen ligase family protein [Candidatus Magasanikbacteria bacterium]